MTTNQIAYHRLREDIRHDIAMEIENYRSNTAGEAIQWFNAREKERADKAGEGIRLAELAETTSYHQASVTETHRSNVEDESISWAKLGLGWAELAETQKYHNASIGLQSQELALKQDQLRLDAERLDMDWYRAETGRLENDVHKQEAQTHAQQLNVAWAQVVNDQQRVENERSNVFLKSQELSLKRDQFEWDKTMDQSRDTREWWNLGLTAFASAFENVSKNAFKMQDNLRESVNSFFDMGGFAAGLLA